MQKLSGKQCVKARALLKWNVQDLSNRVHNIAPSRIENFEKNVIQLYRWEQDAIHKVFTDVGIVFGLDMEVILKKVLREDHSTGMSTQADGARIVLDAEQNVISDSTQKHLTDSKITVTEALEEEKTKKK